MLGTFLFRASLLAALGLLIWAFLAFSVDAHDWYEKTKSPTGALCCGGNDCDRVPGGAVTEVPGGFRVVAEVKGTHVDHVFAYSEMQPSPDGEWHVCVLAYAESSAVDYRCFFGPMPTF
jgi:hypothetical protein